MLSNKTCPACVRAAYSALMRLLDRYLFRELLTPMAYCLGGFLVFWISYDLFTELDKLQDAKLQPAGCRRVCGGDDAGVSGDGVAHRAAAGAAFTRSPTTHATMKITAMRAAGMSLWRIWRRPRLRVVQIVPVRAARTTASSVQREQRALAITDDEIRRRKSATGSCLPRAWR